jgi:predicted TIM-barrel fold metal-dependent hydrolase
MRTDAPLAANRHSAPARDIDVTEYLAVLDAHGVQYGVLTAPSFYGTDNSLLLDALARSQGRLRGTAIVAPDITDTGLDDLHRQGVEGIRLNWVQRDEVPDGNSPAYQALFARLREHGMHVELYLESRLLDHVLPSILRSKAMLVLDHLGYPDPALGVDGTGFRQVLAALEGGNTWVKLSAPYRLGGVDPRPYVHALLHAGGPQRLVWATDWPWVKFEHAVTYAQCVDWLFDWVPDQTQRHAILVDTPRQLFRLEAEQTVTKT